jgi:hypothetical protein
MAKADLVLSTPPMRTSLIQDANRPPEARGDSVDSFSPQPAIGQRTSPNASTKPSGGLSRRHMLAGLAVLPTSAIGIPMTTKHGKSPE